MSDGWPELTESLTDEDFAALGRHGIDIYECRDARWSAHRALKDKYEYGDSDGNWNLTTWREDRPEPTGVLEDAIHAVKYVDGAPIEFGPTAFVGWFTDDGGDA